MQVFLSWSGDRSRAVAVALKTWLGDVIQSITPWVSDQDIQAGARWGADLDAELQKTNYGVLCLTRENMNKPWLLFEAGSLAKSLEVSRVVPYRLDLSETDVKPPLSQFQGVDATENGTLKLVHSINESVAESLPADRLERLFHKFWPDLESEIAKIRSTEEEGTAPERSEVDYLQEILEVVRRLPRHSTPDAEPTMKSAISVVRSVLEKANAKITSMDEYEARGGGGADTSSFMSQYDTAQRHAAALKEALQKLEAADT